jgi:hypothetical protein
MGGGDNVYGSGEQKLEDVIREYAQAVFDLTARWLRVSTFPDFLDTYSLRISARNGSKAD